MKFYSLWLGLICIIVFILQFIFPGFTEVFILNQSAFIQPWRFLTSIFLHGSLPHLLYNLFALVLFGLITEKLIGSRRFLLVFLVSGIIANVIAINFYSSSLGASGAIYGIIGALAIISPMMPVFAFSLPMPMFLASILWIAGDVLGLFMPSNVGHIAHLSGVFVGIIFGLFLRARKKKKDNNYRLSLPEKEIRNWEDSWMR